MIGDDPLFSFIKAEYDLQSLVDTSTLETSIIFSNCSFSHLSSPSYSSPAILYSNAVNQNFAFIDVIYSQISTSFIFIKNLYLILYFFSGFQILNVIICTQSLTFMRNRFINNSVLYNIQVDAALSLDFIDGICQNNSESGSTQSASCFNFKNIAFLNFTNISIENCFSSISTVGIKIFYDQSYAYGLIPNVLILIK